MVAAILAVLKAGRVYVPLDTLSYPADRLAYMVRDSQLSILITRHKSCQYFSDGPDVVYLDREWKDRTPHSPGEFASTTADSLAYLIYTSGSTGVPKAVMGNYRGVVSCVRWMQDVYSFRQDEIIVRKHL